MTEQTDEKMAEFRQRIKAMKEEQRREELAQDAAGECKILSNSGQLWLRISAVDCENVAKEVADGVELRPGGFRWKIFRLMLSGF